MGVHENDLWIASQALAHNLVLVTNERMKDIFEIASNRLVYEIWK
jgi:predicted nucleic acid-binding protein